ncbi:MAG: phosphoenolpyruvate carboxykinase (GTP) [Candidatus Omnitrophica bacterium]|nr:phosphoenolpyruvate carboxykinase (GTP) [Candidatus Omnitrophota bacterium]
MAQMCEPEHIVWIDGSDEQKTRLQREAVAGGELLELNQERLPGCFLHRTAKDDVARTEHLTFICTKNKRDAGPTNNWMSPEEGYRKAREHFQGSMRGRTMYVIPFSMGPVGSEFSKIGVELTDSRYVVLHLLIMTSAGEQVLRELEKAGVFTKCLHAKAQLDISKRLILHFPEDNTIWSVNSGYGGNVLLGKKCLSLRIASHIAHREGWLAEHMLVMGIERPDGQIRYIAGAFPSACGKTNLTMLIPPEGLKHKGYRIWTVGDDIAWMRVHSDGSLRAINPEMGFFGVAPGTNSQTNPTMVKTIERDTIFTNVVLTNEGTVWWEGADGKVPAEGIDWQGRPWKPGQKNENGSVITGAHPNSRFTAPIRNCPAASPEIKQHHGVPISAIILGGRRERVAPLVFESFNWQHGVFVGATMASERTAAQVGKVGEVRRDPMAMLPFCGYHMGDYFKHWLSMGKRMEKPPKIFHVNWFRKDEQGEFLWPGFGDNLRVLEWIIERCNDETSARRTPIGYVPEGLDLSGLELSEEVLEKLYEVRNSDWVGEVEGIEQFFAKFGDDLPAELRDELKALKKRLSSS